jgi:hypothetical protein
MEQYMDDFQNYRRFTSRCACGCDAHCDSSCRTCEACPECECVECKEIDKKRSLGKNRGQE